VTSFFGSSARFMKSRSSFGAAVGRVAIEAVHAADKAQGIPRREAAEEREAFRDDTDLALDFEGVGGEVETQKARCGRRWREQPGHHF